MATFTDTGPLADAVISALEAQNLTVGDGTGQGLDTPYCFVTVLDDLLDGSINDPDKATQTAVQVTYVNGVEGAPQFGRQGVSIIRSTGREALMDRSNVSVSGYSTVDVNLDTSTGPTPDPERDTHDVFFATDTYLFHLQPL